MHYKVSVIVPVYNVEPYLRKCLDSLINQTLKDIEIICINDCSPDNSLTILEEYAEKDDRLKIINFKKNQGVSIARNSGIENAKGKYIGFCDSDDYLDLNFYEKLYEKAEKIMADMVKSSLKKQKPDWVKEYSHFASMRNGKYYDILYPYCYIYRTDFLKKHHISYPENIRLAEDMFFLLTALFYSNNVEIVEDVFYHYIMRKYGAATSCIGEAIVNSFGTPLIFDFMNKNNENENEYADFFSNIFVNNLIMIFAMVEPEYRKALTEIMINIYKNRRYPVTFKNIPKFLNESDFSDLDILFKKLNDNLDFFQYPKIEINNLRNRKIYIWGTGVNAIDALAQCDENEWKVEAFLDSNKSMANFNGYNVIYPQNILSNNVKDYFIIISTRFYADEIAEICVQAGLKKGKDFWSI